MKTLRCLGLLVLSVLCVPLSAQTAKTRAALYTDIDTNLASGSSITAATLRTMFKNVVASHDNGLTGGTLAAYNGSLLTGITWSQLGSTPTTLAGYGIADAITAAAVAAGYQPLNSNLTAIALLSTTSFGRSVLALADASAARTLFGVVIGTDVQGYDPDLAYLAGFTTTANVRSILNAADYAAVKTLLSLDNVTNTSDANKPVSYAQQTALDLKANLTAIVADNVSGVNSDGLLHWSQLIGVPAGFADGTDDGSGGGSGTVTSVNITAPAAGITASGGPVTTSGAITLALADDLAGLESISGTGIAARTASNTWVTRTITGTANELTVTNGDGVSGNPTVSLPAAITLTGKTATGGTFAGAALNGTLGATTPAAATVTTLTSTGAVTQTGATVQVPTAVTGSAINVTTANNTESLTGNVVATFSGSLVNGRFFGITYTTDSTARVVTQPAGVKFNGATVSTITIPASSTYPLQYYTDGTTVFMLNPPSGVLAIPVGKTVTISNTLTLTGTDGTTHTLPSTTSTVARTDAAQTFTGTQTFGAGVFTTVNGNTISTGTGTLTLGASKTLTVSETTTLNRQSSTGLPVEFYVACSDLTTDLTTGTTKAYFRAPYAFTVTDVRASLGTTQSAGSIFTVDVNDSGTTILSTKLTIDNSETTSTTAATAAVISDTAIADDAIVSVDVDQVGTAGARGLIVLIKGYR